MMSKVLFVFYIMEINSFCIVTITIGILLLIALKVYSYRKARLLRQIGYDFVYYYMKNCGALDYYRVKKSHIGVTLSAPIVILQNKE